MTYPRDVSTYSFARPHPYSSIFIPLHAPHNDAFVSHHNFTSLGFCLFWCWKQQHRFCWLSQIGYGHKKKHNHTLELQRRSTFCASILSTRGERCVNLWTIMLLHAPSLGSHADDR